MPFSTLFFDLDDTIYPPTSGLWQAIGERINLFIHKQLSIPWEEIPKLRRKLYQSYGTTMKGLSDIYHIDKFDYLAFVHDLPLSDYIAPDPAVKNMLLTYPQRKFIFTNADNNHAQRVLNALGLSGLFEQIIDIHAVHPYCKPQPESYRIALHQAGEENASHCVLLDDRLQNLSTARQLGFHTIRVGNVDPDPGYHASINTLIDLPKILDPAQH